MLEKSPQYPWFTVPIFDQLPRHRLLQSGFELLRTVHRNGRPVRKLVSDGMHVQLEVLFDAPELRFGLEMPRWIRHYPFGIVALAAGGFRSVNDAYMVAAWAGLDAEKRLRAYSTLEFSAQSVEGEELLVSAEDQTVFDGLPDDYHSPYAVMLEHVTATHQQSVDLSEGKITPPRVMFRQLEGRNGHLRVWNFYLRTCQPYTME